MLTNIERDILNMVRRSATMKEIYKSYDKDAAKAAILVLIRDGLIVENGRKLKASFTDEEESIVKAIFTASQWHSDHGFAVSLLQLSSTYHLHTEELKQQALTEVEDNIEYVLQHKSMFEDGDADALMHLKQMIINKPVGTRWISDSENMRINEIMYQAGMLE